MPNSPSVKVPVLKRSASAGSGALSGAKMLLLAVLVAWQVYTAGRLSAYGLHLLEARDRQEELQSALDDAEAALVSLRNSTESCAQAEKAHATAMTTAAKEKRAVQYKLDETLEMNAWLNQTASAREASLRAEQAQRLSLEGSVSSLKEQMSLMQGQLVTAQQQQGMLHGGGGRRKGKSHDGGGGGGGGGQWH